MFSGVRGLVGSSGLFRAQFGSFGVLRVLK